MIELTSKQRKNLEKLAHNLNPIVIIGGAGLTDGVTNMVASSLEAHELLKVSVLKNCEAETREVAFDLASATNSEIVQIIGRTITLYRKSKKPVIQLPKN
jgi:RNA-binding protein